LNQMEYILGEETFKRALLRYFEEWKAEDSTRQNMELFRKSKIHPQKFWLWYHYLSDPVYGLSKL